MLYLAIGIPLIIAAFGFWIMARPKQYHEWRSRTRRALGFPYSNPLAGREERFYFMIRVTGFLMVVLGAAGLVNIIQRVIAGTF
jgi:hypothetical protein